MTTSHHVPSDQAGSLRPRPASDGPDLCTSRPLRSGRVPAPAPCFGWPDFYIITSPPCRPGPCARALTRTAWTQPCPPDPAGTHCPTRFQPGPRDPPGARPVLPTASRPGHRGQDSRYHHRAILGVCVPHPPEKAIVDVLVPAPSRCRHVPRWGCWGGLVGLRLPRVRPLRPWHGTSSTPTCDHRPRRRSREPPWRRAPSSVGRVDPTHLCCSPAGDANGVRTPWAALNKLGRHKWRGRKFGKPRGRYARVAFELTLRNLGLASLPGPLPSGANL